jgi:5-methylcytosine-specific restriction endonuclease McrA
VDNLCKACRKLANGGYYSANGARIRAQVAAARAANPEWKRDYDREYGQRESYRDYQRSYRTTNRSHLRRQQADKYANDAGYRLRRQMNAAKRRARIAKVQTIPFTAEQLTQKFAYWSHRCWICGNPGNNIDHVKPINKGGGHILCNLRPICQPCNNMKRDKWPVPSRAVILDFCQSH